MSATTIDPAAAERILDALRVLVFTSATRRWLAENDPQALNQAEQALALIPDECLFPDSHRPGHSADRRWHVLFRADDAIVGDWEDLTEAEIAKRACDLRATGHRRVGFSHGSDWDFWWEAPPIAARQSGSRQWAVGLDPTPTRAYETALGYGRLYHAVLVKGPPQVDQTYRTVCGRSVPGLRVEPSRFRPLEDPNRCKRCVEGTLRLIEELRVDNLWVPDA